MEMAGYLVYGREVSCCVQAGAVYTKIDVETGVDREMSHREIRSRAGWSTDAVEKHTHSYVTRLYITNR